MTHSRPAGRAAAPKILLTGFDRFADLVANPSEAIVRQIAAAPPSGITLDTAVLPTDYQAATRKLLSLLRNRRPDAVILLGVAATRNAIELERVAINLDDSETPDNSNRRRRGRRIAAGGPVGYWSTLPISRMAAALRRHRIPVAISNHAGNFLCNHVFFRARHYLEDQSSPVPCGFIHVPQVDGEHWTLASLENAIRLCLATVARRRPK